MAFRSGGRVLHNSGTSMVETIRYILEGTQANFDDLVLRNSRSGLVVVDFWAPWVGPSLRQRELLMRVARQFDGRFLLVTINTDDHPELARRLNIRSLPLFKLFRQGREIESYHGVQPEADYPRIFERHLGGDADPLIGQALRYWQSGKLEWALAELAEAAVQSPEVPRYPELMVKLLMREGRHDDAAAILDALPDGLRENEALRSLHAHLSIIRAGTADADPDALRERLADTDDPDLRFQLASRLVVLDRYEEALEEFLYLARHRADYREDLARRCMLALFTLLGEQEKVLTRFRSALFQLEH